MVAGNQPILQRAKGLIAGHAHHAVRRIGLLRHLADSEDVDTLAVRIEQLDELAVSKAARIRRRHRERHRVKRRLALLQVGEFRCAQVAEGPHVRIVDARVLLHSQRPLADSRTLHARCVLMVTVLAPG